MVKNYLKIAIRILLRNKEYMFINVFGLAVGMACSILVMLHLWEQFEYDDFHPTSERLCRVYIDTKFGGLESEVALTSSLFAFELKKDIPEIEQSCRIYRPMRDIPVTEPISYSFSRGTLLFVDSTFFNVFGFKLIKGNPITCLNNKNSIVLSLSLARKLFPNGNAYGKSIVVEKNTIWKITGIVEDNPWNTHIRYDALISMNSGNFPAPVWTTNFLYTYFRFKPGTDLDKTNNTDFRELSSMEYKLTDIFLKKAENEFRQTVGMTPEDLRQQDNYYVLKLQKIEDIHLFSNLKYEMSQNVNFQTLLILAGISVLIILIGCINYANLSTARLAGRVREIGIRKILGTQKMELSAQLLAESITISFISLLLALALVELAYPEVHIMNGGSSDKNVQLQLLKLSPVIFGITLVTGILAGVYPAFYILRFTPARILQQQNQFSAGGKNLRGLLVIFQFIFSIIIIFSTSTIFRQLRFIHQKGVGFVKENLIVLENVSELNKKSEEFRNSLLQLTGVEGITYTTSVPGRAFQMNSFQSGETRQKSHLMLTMEADSMFVATFGLRIIKGTDKLSKNKRGDTLNVILNQEAVKYLGFLNPIGKQFFEIREQNKIVCMNVIGIVEDFNTESLHSKIQPLVIIPIDSARIRYASVRLNRPFNFTFRDNFTDIWNRFLPQTPFSQFSIEESLGSFYKEEQTTGRIALIFSFLAIFIACMGLYSLLALTTVYRTKEIGIRKVLGAGVRELILLLGKEIFKLIAIAGLIALPLSLLISWYWLDRFAYHVSISFTNYLLVFIAVMIVAIFTVYRQLRRTVDADASESLRYE